MSEREQFLTQLGQVASRLRRDRRLQGLGRAACWFFGALLVYQVLSLALPTPASNALRILLYLLLAAIVGYAIWGLFVASSVKRAAGAVDERVDLKDEIKSALWFSEQGEASPLMRLQVERAQAKLRSIRPAQVVPGALPRSVYAALAMAIMTGVVAWFAPSISHSMNKVLAISERYQGASAAATGAQPAAVARNAQDEAETAAKEAQQRQQAAALAQAQRELRERDGQSISNWDKLDQLANSLKNQGEFDALKQAIKARDAKRAAQLLKELEQQLTMAKADASTQPQISVPFTNEAEGFVPKLQDLFQQGEDPWTKENPDAASDALRESLGKVERKIGETLRGSDQMRHERAYTASITQDQVIEASRYGSRSPEDIEGAESSETGASEIKGGAMHRRAAMTRGDPGEGVSRVGDASGDNEADPVIGKQTQRLAAQLKRVEIEKNSAGEDDKDQGNEQRFFSETQGQQATVAYADVGRRTGFSREEAMSGEQVPLAYRQVVKDYFLNLRQKEK